MQCIIESVEGQIHKKNKELGGSIPDAFTF